MGGGVVRGSDAIRERRFGESATNTAVKLSGLQRDFRKRVGAKAADGKNKQSTEETKLEILKEQFGFGGDIQIARASRGESMHAHDFGDVVGCAEDPIERDTAAFPAINTLEARTAEARNELAVFGRKDARNDAGRQGVILRFRRVRIRRRRGSEIVELGIACHPQDDADDEDEKNKDEGKGAHVLAVPFK